MRVAQPTLHRRHQPGDTGHWPATPGHGFVGAKQGSVLVPMIAAMLILLLTGVALTELFSAQRMKSVLAVQSTQAFWAAEAGIWHAAHEQAEITTPVAFAGSTYTVTKTGDEYTATSQVDQATRVVTLTMLSNDPLDEVASAATANANGEVKWTLDLVSISGSDVVLESFELSTTASSDEIFMIKYDGNKIWEDGGIALPTGVVNFNEGSTADRTIPAGSSLEWFGEFKGGVDGAQPLTLVLHFTDSSTATINFTLNW
jgi:hypothetical protein